MESSGRVVEIRTIDGPCQHIKFGLTTISLSGTDGNGSSSAIVGAHMHATGLHRTPSRRGPNESEC